MKRILFVDDELTLLDQRRTALQGMAHQWEMVFLDNGARALEAMVKRPFDIVVADAQMPGMSGDQLLLWMLKRFPLTVRLAAVDELDRQTERRLAPVAHQVVSKSCDVLALREAVDRARPSRQEVAAPHVRQLLTRLNPLPGTPSAYADLTLALAREEPSAEALGQLIAHDPALTAKVLPLLNSTWFGQTQPLATPAAAIACLGIGAVKNVVLAAQAFAEFTAIEWPQLSWTQLWEHSWRTGLLAAKIVRIENRPHLIDDAFTAGLFHDFGKLLLAFGYTDCYRPVLQEWNGQSSPLWELEQRNIGVTHAEVGAYLLGLWGLPAAVVAGVEWHHRPAQGEKRDFNVATAVHVADALDQERTFPAQPETGSRLDREHLEALGMADRLPVWREHILLDAAA